MADLQLLESRLGYCFRERDLLVRALTHSSLSFDQKGPSAIEDNEQLEFLGDSVLGFLVSECLVTRFASYPEGKLSKLKAHLVSAVRLHEVAQRIGLGQFLRLGRSEEMSAGREKRAILSDAMEAVLAAMYLDGDIGAARAFVEEHILTTASLQAALEDEQVNYKSALQERAQSIRLPQPHYTIVEESGPGHARTFVVEAKVGTSYVSRGKGSSKKIAAQQAAKVILDQMEK